MLFGQPYTVTDLALSVAGPESVVSGDTVSLSVTITNAGSATVDAPELRVLLPSGMEAVEPSCTSHPVLPTQVCPLATLAPGEDVTRSFRALVNAAASVDLTTAFGVVAVGVGETNEEDNTAEHSMTSVSSVAQEKANGVVDRLTLLPNYPNPFNPQTIIRYQLPRPTAVRLTIYDALGREVALLVDTTQPTGSHETIFEAGDLPSGVYLYRLETSESVQTRRMLLVR